jgi:hypothetical protein
MSIDDFERATLDLLNNQRWLLLALLAQAVGFWLLLIRMRALARQVRCLHFCWCNMSDWAIEKLTEARDDYIRDHGESCTPFTLLDAEKEWRTRLDHDIGYQDRAGVRVPRDNHINYVMEDLTA